ncbi:hypothetical protein BC827DRAFT_1154386 [Russula dissimulans]|nr:hypothetical protein BC827DRAFT_1154386 [Russula dissimulans]
MSPIKLNGNRPGFGLSPAAGARVAVGRWAHGTDDAPAISSTLFERRSDGGEAQPTSPAHGRGRPGRHSQPAKVGCARRWGGKQTCRRVKVPVPSHIASEEVSPTNTVHPRARRKSKRGQSKFYFYFWILVQRRSACFVRAAAPICYTGAIFR